MEPISPIFVSFHLGTTVIGKMLHVCEQGINVFIPSWESREDDSISHSVMYFKETPDKWKEAQ